MSADVDFHCWKCGQRHENVPTPLARNEACSGCGRDLHVCRQCSFYDTGVANACREPVAEPVSEKERANFCGYFTVNPEPGSTANHSAGSEDLKALFGLPGSAADGTSPNYESAAKSALDDLFGLDEKKE